MIKGGCSWKSGLFPFPTPRVSTWPQSPPCRFPAYTTVCFVSSSGEDLLSRATELSGKLSPDSGAEQELKAMEQEKSEIVLRCREDKEKLKDCLNAWNEYMALLENLQDWLEKLQSDVAALPESDSFILPRAQVES